MSSVRVTAAWADSWTRAARTRILRLRIRGAIHPYRTLTQLQRVLAGGHDDAALPQGTFVTQAGTPKLPYVDRPGPVVHTVRGRARSVTTVGPTASRGTGRSQLRRPRTAPVETHRDVPLGGMSAGERAARSEAPSRIQALDLASGRPEVIFHLSPFDRLVSEFRRDAGTDGGDSRANRVQHHGARCAQGLAVDVVQVLDLHAGHLGDQQLGKFQLAFGRQGWAGEVARVADLLRPAQGLAGQDVVPRDSAAMLTRSRMPRKYKERLVKAAGVASVAFVCAGRLAGRPLPVRPPQRPGRDAGGERSGSAAGRPHGPHLALMLTKLIPVRIWNAREPPGFPGGSCLKS